MQLSPSHSVVFNHLGCSRLNQVNQNMLSESFLGLKGEKEVRHANPLIP